MAVIASSPGHRIVRLAAGSLLILFLAAWAFFASIPFLFGKDVGAGYAAVDLSLCVLGSDGAADILVGGDSRAKGQVDPIQLETLTGKRAINVAEDITFGGDLPTLANALRHYPRMLAEAPVLIVSVSVTGFNDLALDDLPAASVLDWSPWDHARVAAHRPGRYFRYLFGAYFPFLGRHILHEVRHTGFRCQDGLYLPPAIRAARGFRPNRPRLVVQEPGPQGAPGPAPSRAPVPGPGLAPRSEADFLLDGGRRRAFARALDWLAASPARAIVIYAAPIDPEWRADPAHSVEMGIEHRFADLVAAETARKQSAWHGKVHFVDFAGNPPPGLTSADFADDYHLNESGAAVFTRHLAGLLRDSGWIAP
jgi:hypothetical protein